MQVTPRHFVFNQDLVYEVSSETDTTVVLAIVPAIQHTSDKSYVVWFDTHKERIFQLVTITVDTPEVFSFKNEAGATYTFTVLSFQRFKENIVPQLDNPEIADNIHNEAQMKQLIMESLEGN